jgi:hypothetical protein
LPSAVAIYAIDARAGLREGIGLEAVVATAGRRWIFADGRDFCGRNTRGWW